MTEMAEKTVQRNAATYVTTDGGELKTEQEQGWTRSTLGKSTDDSIASSIESSIARSIASIIASSSAISIAMSLLVRGRLEKKQAREERRL